jgi:hypothetical protein
MEKMPSINMKIKIALLLLAIFIFGGLLRFFNYKNGIIFAYDQARDSERIYAISKGDIKIVGPETDIPGIFSGPLIYYLLLPVYKASDFNQVSASGFLILLNLSVIFLVYLISKNIFQNMKISLLSALFFSLSYQSINFSKHINNSSLVMLSIGVFFLGLVFYFFQKRRGGLLISAIGLGMAIQADFYLIYLLPVYFIFAYIYETKIKKLDIIFSGAVLLFFLSNFILAEIKWKMIGVKSLINFAFAQKSGGFHLGESLELFIRKISEAYYYSIVSSKNICLFVFIILTVALFFVARKKKRTYALLIWLFITLPLFYFRTGVLSTSEINLPIVPAVAISFAFFIVHFFVKRKLTLVAFLLSLIVVFSNQNLMKKSNYKNSELFNHQPLYLSEEKKMIDYTYYSSKRQAFSLCSVSVPLFSNILWSYNYKFYGEKKWGYLPYWIGQKQISVVNNLIEKEINPSTISYLIIEPYPGIPEFAIKASILLADKKTVLIEEKNFGGFIVQKRIKRIQNDDRKMNSGNISKEEMELLEKNIIAKDARYDCNW